MKKIYLFALVPFIIGIGCLLAYVIIGSSIAPDGTLIEPFGLIPTGFFLMMVGLVVGTIISVWSLFHNPQKSDKWILGSLLGLGTLASVYIIASMSTSAPYNSREAIQNTQIPPAGVDTKNATYVIDGNPVSLVNGKNEQEIMPESATKLVTEYVGKEIKIDLNNDGVMDSALFLSQDPGGSGTFYYLAVVFGSKNGPLSTDAVILGDRISPEAITFENGELKVVYLDRKSDEAMSVVPNIITNKYFKIETGKLVEVVKQ